MSQTTKYTPMVIKASELRLGNLVLQNGEVTPICNLDRGGQTFLHINDIKIHKETGREQTTHELIVQPIPLTEEWLLKFGFKEVLGCWQNKDVKLYEVIDHSGYRLDLKMNKLQYVHELQNLYFALTKKELEVKP